MEDKEYNKLQEKIYLANKADRAKNTAELSKKLDELKPIPLPDFPMEMKVKIEGIEVLTLKGDKGEQGEKGDSGEKGDKGKDGKNGKDSKGVDGTNGIDGKDGKDGVDGNNGVNGKDGSPDTSLEIKNKLSELKGDERLDIESLKGLDKVESNFLNQAKGFVSKSLSGMYDVAINNPIDGQALVYSASKGKWIAGAVVSSSVGTGFTLLPATGTVDGLNTDFTFTQKPTYIISDGAWYIENSGWTWSGLTATMSVPPQTGIWGFV